MLLFNLLFPVFIGGGLGSVCRVMLTKFASHTFGTYYPYGITTCNIIGSLLIGFIAVLIIDSHREWLAPLLIGGFLGGFTTFSSFSYDSVMLFLEGELFKGFLNVAINLIISLCATAAGMFLAKLIVSK